MRLRLGRRGNDKQHRRLTDAGRLNAARCKARAQVDSLGLLPLLKPWESARSAQDCRHHRGDRMRVEARLALFKRLVFKNAIRLFEDASLFFQARRFPSAFALAVTSFEELGKMHLIDRGCDAICLNPNRFDELYQGYFTGPWLTDHLHKQRRALFDALELTPDEDPTLWAWVHSGGLENERRIALYVEMTSGSVFSTDRVSEAKAKRVLELCYDGLRNSAELAFNGFAAMPSDKGDRLAATAIKQIEAAHARYSHA
jgi:AbiV family abortive infection protein